MESFAVYPKEGERFELEFTRFEIDATQRELVLYDDSRRELGVLILNHISGVAPTEPRELERSGMRIYTVYLRDHITPIIFDAAAHNNNPPYNFQIDGRPLTDVYIDPAEVVAFTYTLRHRALPHE